MKKSALLNSELSYLTATLGHFDEITVCDAGLPIENKAQRIDLALTYGIPSFIDTVKVLLDEIQITGALIASEMKDINPTLHEELIKLIKLEESENRKIEINYLTHEEFKKRTHKSKAVIRTGECSPYANVVFQSGVVF